MKTAIQELIEKLNDGFLENKYSNHNDIINTCKSFLEKEKQQIVDSNNQGYRAGRGYFNQTATEYYNETFKND